MITLDQANTIVDTALQHGQETGLRPLTVAVLDAGGHLVTLKRSNGSSIMRPQIAHAKAWGVLALGVGGRDLAKRAAAHPAFFTALSNISQGQIAPVPGGVIIRDANAAIIGSVGISGDLPEQDEACAVAGIQKAGLVADPG